MISPENPLLQEYSKHSDEWHDSCILRQRLTTRLGGLLASRSPAVGWLYKYAWFVGLLIGFVAYLAIVHLLSSGKDGVPEAYQPIGAIGEEHAEVVGEK